MNKHKIVECGAINNLSVGKRTSGYVQDVRVRERMLFQQGMFKPFGS